MELLVSCLALLVALATLVRVLIEAPSPCLDFVLVQDPNSVGDPTVEKQARRRIDYVVVHAIDPESGEMTSENTTLDTSAIPLGDYPLKP